MTLTLYLSIIPTLQKHYLLGRIAIELAYVMPDRRTVYTTDDGTNVGKQQRTVVPWCDHFDAPARQLT